MRQPLCKAREWVARSFSLTRQEAGSLLLVLAIVLIGLVANVFLRA